MKKQLFFDDGGLFVRENAVRRYGKPALIAVYQDGVSSCDFATGFVFRLEDGSRRMLYYARVAGKPGGRLFSARSGDGVHFSPERLYEPGDGEKAYAHEVMFVPEGCEVAFVYEDPVCQDREERYKLLMTELDADRLWVEDVLYVSPDLIRWTRKEGFRWGDGTEPLASVFFNRHRQTHTVVQRPFWGVRMAGFKETADWKTMTEYQPCLRVDPLDEPLSEIYGMYAFEYEGVYIGLPHLYRGLKSELNAKFFGGTIDTQLAYSYDGRYWQRSLREPFLSGLFEECRPKYGLTWCLGSQRAENGDVYLYAAASELEHGPAFAQPGTGRMLVYRLRADGFICLKSADPGAGSAVATREKIWLGGEPHYNLKAKRATAAVYITDETAAVSGNLLGFSRPAEGMGHEDCIPFEGDSTDWVPVYKTGKKAEDLTGKTLVFELRFTDGEVFSFCGEYEDAFNTQAARFRKFGILPGDLPRNR